MPWKGISKNEDTIGNLDIKEWELEEKATRPYSNRPSKKTKEKVERRNKNKNGNTNRT